MLAKLFVLFVVVPASELMLLIKITEATDLSTTIMIILITGIIGATLAKQQGLQALMRIQQSLQQGKMPADEIVDGLMILIAGVVLITPGLLTDTAGFLLLIPPCRSFIKKFVVKSFKKRMVVMTPNGAAGFGSAQKARPQRPASQETIDVSATVVEEKKSDNSQLN